jgi:predicted dehydrogenase
MGLSIGIVGCGRFSPGFIGLFRDHPLVDRVALCDIHPERVADYLERFNLTEGYASLDDICRSDLDAIVLMTQPWLHAPQAVQVMQAGKHVWSAVPLISLPDGDEMLEWCDTIVTVSQSSGMHYFLAETSYYYPGAVYCRRRASEGAFGQFVYATGCYFHDYQAPLSDLTKVARHRWGDQWDISKSGDTPMHYPTHSIGGFLGAVNSHVTRVSCLGYRHPDDEWFREDTVYNNPFSNEVAMMRLANGTIARLAEFRRIAGPNHEGIQLYGTQGCYVEHDESGGFWANRHEAEFTPVSVEQMRDPLPPEVAEAFGLEAEGESDYGGHHGSHPFLVHEFVDALAKGRRPVIDAWQAARYLAPGVMAHKSAMKEGEWLDVPDWGDGPN